MRRKEGKQKGERDKMNDAVDSRLPPFAVANCIRFQRWVEIPKSEKEKEERKSKPVGKDAAYGRLQKILFMYQGPGFQLLSCRSLGGGGGGGGGGRGAS
jgi:hypothetical protein